MGKSIFDYVKDAKDYYDEYKDLIDLGGQAGKAYLDYKDQKRRNELDESAYRDYMLEKESAGQEAQTADDINLTPMEVTGVPTSKADVTSFQAVANGGIIGLKNGGAPNAGIAALRKKAPGVVKRMGFAMGTGLKNPTGIENIDTTIIENPQGEPPRILEENMQMAEIPKDLTMDEAVRVFKLSNDRDPISIEEVIEFFKNRKLSAKGGIIGLRNGGRPGYMMGEGPVMDGTVKIEDAVMETEEPMKMAYSAGDSYDVSKMSYNTLKKHFNSAELPGLSGSDYNDEELRLLLIDLDRAMYFDSREMAKGGIANLKKGGIANLRKKYAIGSDPDEYDPYEDMSVKEILIEEGYPTANEAEFEEEFGTLGSKNKTDNTMKMAYNSGTAYSNNEGVHGIERAYRIWQILPDDIQGGYGGFQDFFETSDWHGVKMKKGGRVKYANGSDGILDLGGREKDYRFNGGFVPIGEYEKKDDVPARLSKNEFVFTADAVRAAGGGSINKGAQKMYNTMKTLEAQPTAKRMTA